MSPEFSLPLPRTPRPDAGEVGEFVLHGLDRARELADQLPLPGEGETGRLWTALSHLGRQDLAHARIIEPHLDAVAIVEQAGCGDLLTGADSWAVWAAEGPGDPLVATPAGAIAPPTTSEAAPPTTHGGAAGATWTLTGTKPWCSLAHFVSRAVVTAHVADQSGELTGHRRAFVISTDHPGFQPEPAASWAAQGLAEVPTTAVTFHAVPAQPLGEDEWYLTRPGFAWGGMGVAAVWLGGARSVADLLWRQCRDPRRPLDHAAAHLGRVAVALGAASAVLEEAARAVDGGAATGQDGAVWALRVRRTVAEAAETVLREVSRATGPGPITHDAAHIRRVAALQVYIRQDHAERDDRALGELLLARAAGAGSQSKRGGEQPW